MIALLLACHGTDPKDHGHPADDTGEPLAGRPVLVSPAPAGDLDEAAGAVRVAFTAEVATVVVGEVAYDGYAYDGHVPGPTIHASRPPR